MANGWRALLAWGLIALGAIQLLIALPEFRDFVSPLVASPTATYEDKMRAKWGSYYELMQVVRRESPENAVILLEPGDYASVDLYFLYPRTVLHGGQSMLDQHPEIGYVVIDGNYPSFPVPGDRLMMDEVHGIYRIWR